MRQKRLTRAALSAAEPTVERIDDPFAAKIRRSLAREVGEIVLSRLRYTGIPVTTRDSELMGPLHIGYTCRKQMLFLTIIITIIITIKS